MIYLDDKLPRHPKIMIAGSLLGANGGALALALHVYAIGYCREHLTNGFIPQSVVDGCSLVSDPKFVANVLVSRHVRLWHLRKSGYQIHDWLDWNRSASQIKEKREKWKAKKRRQRVTSPGDKPGDSLGESRGYPVRSRAPYHVPRTDPGSTEIRDQTVPSGQNERAVTRRSRGDARPHPEHRGRYAFCGRVFCVPRAVHESQVRRLGPIGATFDLLGKYAAWDNELAQAGTPVPGGYRWLEQRIDDEAGVLPIARASAKEAREAAVRRELLGP